MGASHLICFLDLTRRRVDFDRKPMRWYTAWVDTLRLRQETHAFCAFIDIRKAFDAAWVEATLVRLAQVGVTGSMWRTITNFLVGTLSHVHVGDAHSHSWVDTGVAQGRVLSPLLFNLLVNSVAADIPSLAVQVSACITRQVSGSSASYMQMTWSFLRTRRRICSLGSTQLPI